ncbi:unnamed protein product [Acanthosepion pharaonis]|uniref:Dynein regulatory complex protein 10 n=1 Tax=Acanthosepion pharaonis TaxID=158019 RepID=A0A812D005_ACAPH|nr:unnamed protein product [Sepia pharaonis]
MRMDPTRALEPTKKKLTSIEAQRIMNVFVDTINRAKLVSMIPYITENIAQFEPHFNAELLTLFKQHIDIQKCYLEIKREIVRRHEKRQRKFSEGSQEETLCDDNCESTQPEAQQEDAKDVPIDDDNYKEDASSPKPEIELPERVSSSVHTSISEGTCTSPVGEGQEAEEEQVEDSEGEKCEEKEEDDEEYKTATEMLMRNLSIVAEQLSNSCKNILRAFTKYSSAITAVHNELHHISPAAAKFIRNLEEMKVILRNRLLTSPLEERDQAEYLKEMIQKTQQNTQQIQKLEAELAEAIAIKEEETRRKNDIIRRLQEEIRQIDKQSEDNIRRVKMEAEKNISSELKTSDGKCAKIQQELILSRNSLQNLTNDHRNQEMELRRRNYKAETEVENWIQKYDQDMGQLQDEYETIESIYKEEKKQLSELEEKFTTLQKEYLVIIDEREMARRMREESERKMIVMRRLEAHRHPSSRQSSQVTHASSFGRSGSFLVSPKRGKCSATRFTNEISSFMKRSSIYAEDDFLMFSA